MAKQTRTKRKPVNTLGALAASNLNGSVEETLQGDTSNETAVSEKKEKEEKQEKAVIREDNQEQVNEQEKGEVVEEKEDKKDKREEETEEKKKRVVLADFLERPADFVREKTETLVVNKSQRDLLKLLATLEGTPVNILVHNIIDEFLEEYEVKELASIIDKKKRKFR